MKTAKINYEYLKIRVDRIADARGIIFTEKLQFVKKALQTMDKGDILKIYCSDLVHKKEIPKWVNDQGHIFLSIIEEANYFKILIKKG